MLYRLEPAGRPYPIFVFEKDFFENLYDLLCVRAERAFTSVVGCEGGFHELGWRMVGGGSDWVWGPATGAEVGLRVAGSQAMCPSV